MKKRMLPMMLVCSVLSFFILIFIFVQFAMYGNMYDLSDETVLSDYAEVHHSMLYSSSILDHKELEANMFLFCGNGSICDITATQKATMELSHDHNWGKGKLLLENQESGEISSISLNSGETEVVVNPGNYRIFLVGKWLGGKFTLKSDYIFFDVDR